MAKKSQFNMSAEIRALLKEKQQLTGPELYAKLSQKNPSQKINKNSFGVAFSTARRKLGISRKRRPSVKGKRITRRVAKPSSDFVSLSALRSARDLLTHTKGDVSMATTVLREVKAMLK